MIIKVEANPEHTILDIKGVLNARFSFSYKLQYHDAFSQILQNDMKVKEYHDSNIFI
jgi:hypothetical protein